MSSNQINQYQQSETTEISPISAHFRDLMNQCSTTLVPILSDLTIKVLEVFPAECHQKVIDSGNFQEWSLLEETIMAIKQDHEQIVNRYSDNISAAFIQFIRGEAIDSGSTDDSDSDFDSQLQALTLLDNDQMEVSVMITTIATGAAHHYSDELYALGRRLAMINHGNLLDDQDKSFLLGPTQLCYAFVNSIQICQLESRGEQALLTAFQQHVINKLEPVYQQFNTMLVAAGVLPNIVYTNRQSNGQATSQPTSQEITPEAIEQQQLAEQDSPQPQADQADPEQSKIGNAVQHDVAQGIMALLSERRQIKTAAGSMAPAPHISPQQVVQRRDHLVTAIGNIQQSIDPGILTDTGNFSLDAVRAQIHRQTTQISKDVAEIQPDTADADLIDMVGMLFEYILNDDDLPDKIKALLCHLHTPYLKVALLDRQIFMEVGHPARRLLDALSEAGILCVDDNKNTLNILAIIRETVKRVLDEFDKEAEIFEELLENFNVSMENINRRQSVVQKRSVDSAKGQQKIKNAREVVSRTVIEKLVKHPQIPKVMESLLMGSWSNYLMITLLRNDQSSEEWQRAIKLTNDLIWSVEPKHTFDERKQLKKRLPKIVSDTRHAIKNSGNTEEENDVLITKLQKCHELVLLGYYTQEDTSNSDADSHAKHLSNLKRIMPEEWKEGFKEKQRAAKISTEIKELFSLETCVEFTNSDSNKTTRGRIAWVNEDHSQCLLVNEAGRQIAIQTVDELNRSRLDGRLKILKKQEEALFDRALHWIQKRIQNDTSKITIAT
ncbi:MAG: DUF1631 family protein [Methylococcales bacterium]